MYRFFGTFFFKAVRLPDSWLDSVIKVFGVEPFAVTHFFVFTPTWTGEHENSADRCKVQDTFCSGSEVRTSCRKSVVARLCLVVLTMRVRVREHAYWYHGFTMLHGLFTDLSPERSTSRSLIVFAYIRNTTLALKRFTTWIEQPYFIGQLSLGDT